MIVLAPEKRESMIKHETGYDTSELIALAQVYLDEWRHRDEFLWRERIQLGIIALVASLLPWFKNIEGFEVGFLSGKYEALFPVIGMVLSLYFGVITYLGGNRVKAASSSYRNIIKLLPHQGHYVFLSREDEDDALKYLLYNTYIAQTFTVVYFFGTFAIAVVAHYI